MPTMVLYSEKCDGIADKYQSVVFIFFFPSQYWFIRLLSSARVGGRHNGQDPDEDVDCVHVYSNRPAEKHIFFNSPFVSITGIAVLLPTPLV